MDLLAGFASLLSTSSPFGRPGVEAPGVEAPNGNGGGLAGGGGKAPGVESPGVEAPGVEAPGVRRWSSLELPEAALLAMLSANSNFLQLITECPPSLQGLEPALVSKATLLVRLEASQTGNGAALRAVDAAPKGTTSPNSSWNAEMVQRSSKTHPTAAR